MLSLYASQLVTYLDQPSGGGQVNRDLRPRPVRPDGRNQLAAVPEHRLAAHAHWSSPTRLLETGRPKLTRSPAAWPAENALPLRPPEKFFARPRRDPA